MKTVILTGGNGHLGAAVTKEFLDKNYQLLATVSNENALTDFEEHPNLHVSVVNLTDEKETNDFVEKSIHQYGTIDGAVLLVGGFAMGGIDKTNGEDLKKQISLNFETAYYVIRPLFDHLMKNKKGKIILIGARPAINPTQGKDLIAYSLSKSLLFRLSEFLNETAKGTSITVSIVIPSTLDTPLNRKSMPDADPEKWVKPAEIAETLEFLISDKSNAFRETVLKMYNNA